MAYYDNLLIEHFGGIDEVYRFIRDYGGISRALPEIERKTNTKWTRQTLSNVLRRYGYVVPRGKRPGPKFAELVKQHPNLSARSLLRLYLNDPTARTPGHESDYENIRYAKKRLKRLEEISNGDYDDRI